MRTHRTTPGPHPSAAAPPGAATALLDAYRPGTDRFLAAPGHTLLAHGTAAEIPHDSRPLAQRVRETLDARRRAGAAAPMVVGSLPFAPDAPHALAVPDSVRWAPPLHEDPLVALPVPAAEAIDWQVREVPSAERYGEAVAAAVARMRAGEFDKVVLARTLELTARHEPDLTAMLRRLARRDPAGYTFAVPSGRGRTLIGASPELLVARRGGRLVANPLAGSAPRSARPGRGRPRARPRFWSRRRTSTSTRSWSTPYARRSPRTARAWRCPSARRSCAPRPCGICRPRSPASWPTRPSTALELAAALHPTPAVCGTPTDVARAVIAASEPFDRGPYTGMVGWQDADGDGEWVVTIRCAEAEGRRLRLFAGAGVVADSSPRAETAETGAKFRTFLSAVGAAL